MKKLLLLSLLVIALCYDGYGQELGLRFGDIVGNNIAIDAAFKFKRGRMHADVSFGNKGVGVEALYDFVNIPIANRTFNVYAGVGAYALFADPFKFGVPGELGLEYRFKGIPIVLGADWRPALELINESKMRWERFGLNVRWAFGEK